MFFIILFSFVLVAIVLFGYYVDLFSDIIKGINTFISWLSG